MSWLHRLQQRLSITRNEALTLLSLSLFLLVGSAGRYACRQMSPVSPEYYAEFDSLFAHRSSAVLDRESENIADIRPGGEPSFPGNVPPSDSLVEDLFDVAPAERADIRSDSKPLPQDFSESDPKPSPQDFSESDSNPASQAFSGSDSKPSPQAPGQSALKPSPQAFSGSEPKPSPKIDLNSAAMSDLEQLPRVGPKIAERIIAFRNAYGPFRSVDELSSVSGIGPKTLELIRPHAIVIADSAR